MPIFLSIHNTFPSDEEAPYITCPPNQVQQTSGQDVAVSWPPAVAIDNVALRSVDPIVYSVDNGATLPVSDVPVVIEATAYDSSDNEATCEFTVLVEGIGVCTGRHPNIITSEVTYKFDCFMK